MKKLPLSFLAFFVLLFAACSSGNAAPTTTGTPTLALANGFGTAQNHVHSLVILPDANQTMVLATHYGVFRSQDHGATWQKTAGGPNQPMQGLMAWWLTYNPLNPQRLYVMTQPNVFPHAGTIGLYTSDDGGKTWQLASASTSISSSNVFLAQAGNASPSEVYVYLNGLGALGLKVSEDNGVHFAQAGSQLPFGSLLGILPIPNEPGHLLVYGNEGAALTSDGGKHWQIIKSLQDTLFEMVAAGSRQIYARGGAGIYSSHDGGQSFSLVNQTSYASLTSSSQQPNILYGKLALAIYRSNDGGKTWSQLPAIKGNFQVLATDPSSADQVYLALSYPAGAYHFANNAWKSLTPPA